VHGSGARGAAGSSNRIVSPSGPCRPGRAAGTGALPQGCGKRWVGRLGTSCNVQSYHTLVAPLAMTKALRLRVPYCLTFHGGGHTSEAEEPSGRCSAGTPGCLCWRERAGLVAVARFEVDLFSEPLGIPREKFRVIPVGTDLTVRDDVDVTGAGGTARNRLDRQARAVQRATIA